MCRASSSHDVLESLRDAGNSMVNITPAERFEQSDYIAAIVPS